MISSRRAHPAAAALTACGVLAGCGGHSGPPRGSIYWTQSPNGGPDEGGSIGRAKLSGSSANGRFIVGTKAPGGIVVSGRYIYWASYATGTIARARLDGSDVKQRFIKSGDEYSVIGNAVDRDHVYWTNSGIDPNSGTIGRANLDGQASTNTSSRPGTRRSASRSTTSTSTGRIATGTRRGSASTSCTRSAVQTWTGRR